MRTHPSNRTPLGLALSAACAAQLIWPWAEGLVTAASVALCGLGAALLLRSRRR